MGKKSTSTKGTKYSTYRKYNTSMKQSVGLRVVALQKANKMGVDNIRKSCFIKIKEREIDILPFLINMLSFIDDDDARSMMSLLYAENKEKLLGMALRDEDWYIGMIGENNYNILMSLCGHFGLYISRYIAIGAMQLPGRFFLGCVAILAREAEAVSKGDRCILEYSDGVQNTMGLSYYLVMKWFKDMKFISEKALNLGSIEETVNRLLDIPGPIKDYFDGLIDEKELLEEQQKAETDNEDHVTGLSPVSKETLESYGIPINIVNKDNISNLVFVSDVLYSQCSGQCFDVFRGNIAGTAIRSDIIPKMKEDRDFFRAEYYKALDASKESKRESRQTAKKVNKLASENARLHKEVERLKELNSRLPYDTKKNIDDLNSNIASKNEEIVALQKQVMDLKNGLSNKGKEISHLRTDNKKLKNEIARAMEDIDGLQEELSCDLEYDEPEIDCSIPFDAVLNVIKNKKLLIIGGATGLEQSLDDLGLDAKQYDGKMNVSLRNFGNYDCMVFMTKMLGHSMMYKAKREAKSLGKPIVNFNGSNVEMLCRQIYEVFKEN